MIPVIKKPNRIDMKYLMLDMVRIILRIEIVIEIRERERDCRFGVRHNAEIITLVKQQMYRDIQIQKISQEALHSAMYMAGWRTGL
jgi:hypothetical protein